MRETYWRNMADADQIFGIGDRFLSQSRRISPQSFAFAGGSFAFALLICGTIPWKQLFLNARFQSFLFSGIQLIWPASFLVGVAIISAFQGAILLAALSVFIVGTKSFHPRSFLIALFSALLVLALGNTAVTVVQVLPWPRLFFYSVIWQLPLFFGLVLSTWIVSANAGRTGAALPPHESLVGLKCLVSRVTGQLAASKQGRFLERKPREPKEPSTLFPVLWHQVIQTTVFRRVRSIPSASRSRQSVRSFISV